MECDKWIHEEMKEMDQSCCPFCNRKLQDGTVKHELCCEKQLIIDDNCENVCQSCGTVHGYNIYYDYVDFNTDRARIVKKISLPKKVPSGQHS